MERADMKFLQSLIATVFLTKFTTAAITFEYNHLSRMFVFAEISEEEEETFHSLDDIFWILNRSFSLNRMNP